MPHLTISPVDRDDDAAWQATIDVFNAIAREVAGDHAQHADADALRRAERPVETRRRWRASAVLDGRVVGFVSVKTMLDSSPTSSYLDVGVLADATGQGCGRALAEAGLAMARQHGALRVDAWIAAIPGLRDAQPARALATSLGFVRNAVDLAQECPLPLTVTTAVPDGYRFEVLTGEPPVELYDDLRVLLRTMNSDVPQGETPLPVKDWPDDSVRGRFACGKDRQWILIARDPAGDVAGFTELGNTADEPDRGRLAQGDTIVLREHRGHGLGLAMKVAAMARAWADAPWMTVAQTSNDQTNSHMIAINERLGFREVARVENWTWTA